jgi:hypothetical protein
MKADDFFDHCRVTLSQGGAAEQWIKEGRIVVVRQPDSYPETQIQIECSPLIFTSSDHTPS